MHRKEKTSRIVIRMIIAVIVAAYVLFPFFLVVINSCKETNDITANPIGFNGIGLGQLITNLTDVINNTHFLFWQAFWYSVVITVLSLVLLALFGSMAAWVICRNHTKWSTVIYFTFIASMIIPFQVVMLP
ncbi:MAG: carbohydrate ABC transporter permease, partial [Lachnospiraceae bacterium]|nr:carbohydrate ABC transporter permease [Lachnospiraceae bacterium]